jgi:hypothetical protein
MSFDSVEKGVVYVGVRNSFGGDSKTVIEHLHNRLLAFGFGNDLQHLSSVDFATTDSFAAVMPPIALWPIPLHMRAALLSGDLFYACLVDRAIWNRVFAECGVMWQADGRRWVLEMANHRVILNPFDVVRIVLGVHFAAVSPREVATVVAELLARRPLRQNDKPTS